MQQGPIVYDDVIGEITTFFEEQIAFAMQHGIHKDQLIIDPGVGFGKTVQHNLEIIRRIGAFCALGMPVLIGVSRKGHLGALLKEKLHLAETPPADERLEAALAETAVAIMHGASYVRTHDVLQTARFVRVIEELL
jgi:dihydropteroate synthase